ncbi:MAG: hypothetical protein Fues2KO_02950 [Fuerstiella sp.]
MTASSTAASFFGTTGVLEATVRKWLLRRVARPNASSLEFNQVDDGTSDGSLKFIDARNHSPDQLKISGPFASPATYSYGKTADD